MKSWEAHQRNQRFGGNESVDIRKRQRLRKEGNAQINKVFAMRPGLRKIIEKVRITWYFECSATDLHQAQNACCIDHADTWSSKRIHRLRKIQSPHCCASDCGCEDTLELDTGVAQEPLPVTGFYTQAAPKSKLHWFMATFHNWRRMDHCKACQRSIEVISILHHVDIEEA
jgi:hypothetical protein